jgi:hypothetical protein
MIDYLGDDETISELPLRDKLMRGVTHKKLLTELLQIDIFAIHPFLWVAKAEITIIDFFLFQAPLVFSGIKTPERNKYIHSNPIFGSFFAKKYGFRTDTEEKALELGFVPAPAFAL